MSNKNNYNNSVLHSLLLELLGADIEFIVFGVCSDYTTIIFNDINVRTFDKCQSVIETLVHFNIINVIDYFSKDGLYTFYIKFQ